MHSAPATPLLYTPSSNIKTRTHNLKSSTPNQFFFPHRRTNFQKCGASSQYSPITHDFNLYELLGIDASSDKAQIKEAYRALQKRCHPDIAGPPGHDMAIVLNEAYDLLSDPVSRMAYDKELAKVSDFQGYTGKPIYSAWCGSESEQRAVFVDEVKCVGCLKCALFADKTFAVESVYGRARVVAQWADPEHKIQEAIGACPVDCIATVERSNLAALEFLMSKQPRVRVRIGASNTAGVRISDVFDELEKFQARYAKHKDSTSYSKDTDDHRASRMSAIQAIQMITNWIYWQSPTTDSAPLATRYLPPATKTPDEPILKRLKAAAEARSQSRKTTQPSGLTSSTSPEYWVPSALELPETAIPDVGSKSVVDPSPSRRKNRPNSAKVSGPRVDSGNPLRWGVPIATGVLAAAVVRSHLGEPVDGIKEHMGGSLALAIVNSPWMQVALAGVTWYLIGMYIVELVVALRRK